MIKRTSAPRDVYTAIVAHGMVGGCARQEDSPTAPQEMNVFLNSRPENRRACTTLPEQSWRHRLTTSSVDGKEKRETARGAFHLKRHPCAHARSEVADRQHAKVNIHRHTSHAYAHHESSSCFSFSFLAFPSISVSFGI